MEWFRWYHGAISDTKWPLIARKSKQNIGTVVSIWAAILEHASQDEERGSIEGFDPEAIDALFGYDDGVCQSVVNAMEEKGLLVDGCVATWTKRQPKREREDDSLDRVRKHRAEKKANKNAEVQDVTPCNASVTPVQRQETPRTEKRREEYKNPPTPHGGTGDEKTPNPKTPSGDYAPDFEAAWKVYPRKDGKRKAFAAWQKAKKRGMPVADMPAHIDARAYEPDWLKDDGRYVPHMASWLNADGWLDEGAALPTPRPPDDDDDFWAVDFWGNPLTPKAEPEVRS